MKRLNFALVLRLIGLSMLISANSFADSNPPVETGKITINGQTAKVVDAHFNYGVFHIYEAFKVGDHEARKMIVYVPKDLKIGSDQAYPVQYYFDGQSIFFPDNFVGKSWRLGQTIDAMQKKGKHTPSIYVGIYPLERNKEYTHAFVLGQPCCGLKKHAEYITTEVKGFIDRSYPTSRDRNKTSIIGSSHGGLAAFYTGTRYAEKFGNIVSLSPSFWVGLFPVNWAFSLKKSELITGVKDLLNNDKKRPRIYLSWGLVRSGGFHNSFIERLSTLRTSQLTNILRDSHRYAPQDLKTIALSDGEHDEDTWAQLMPGVLSWVNQD